MSSRRLDIRGRARLGVLALATVGAVALSGCDASEDADLDRGRALFQQKCGTCHTLAQAGTGANVGPNLDSSFATARADGMDSDTIEGVVQAQIANPRTVDKDVPNYQQVYMPADIVTGQDAEDVAAYVGSVAGVPGAKPPQLPPDQLFVEQCGSCHVLSAAGTAGNTGPNLDEVLAGKDAKFVEKGIVDPNAQIAQGYSAGIMPQDFETRLSPEDLDGLVQYILDSVKSGQ